MRPSLRGVVEPAGSRARVVVGFYALLSLVALAWHAAGGGGLDPWRLDAGQGLAATLVGAALGAIAGHAAVAGFRWLEPRTRWIPALGEEVRGLLGRPRPTEVYAIALASAVGEELLFRGAALDAWGLLPSSILFGLLHVPPRFALWPWTVSAALAGLAFGGLCLLSGNLAAAVTAHFVINLRNLRHLTTAPAFRPKTGPQPHL